MNIGRKEIERLREVERKHAALQVYVAKLEAKNEALEKSCRAMLAGDVTAYRMMRAALENPL